MDGFKGTVVKINNVSDDIISDRLIAKTGDSSGRYLYIQLTNKENTNLKDSILSLAYRTPSGVVNEIGFDLVDENTNTYMLTYDDMLLKEAGVVNATIRIKKGGTVTETPNFGIYVEESPLDGKAFVESDGLTFSKVLSRVDFMELRTSIMEKDINYLNDQLQEVNTKIVLVDQDETLPDRVYTLENDVVLLDLEVDRLNKGIEYEKENGAKGNRIDDLELDLYKLEVKLGEVVEGIDGIKKSLSKDSPDYLMRVVNHGSDMYVLRPESALAVYWVGSVEPINANDNDLWVGGVL